MTQRFYRGPAVSADAEVPAADAPALRTYTKAQFRDDGALTRTEVYDGGRPIEVNYYDPEDEDRTVASHAREYPGIRLSIWTTLGESPEYVWKYVRSYDAAGAPVAFSKILADRERRELMQIEMDERHRVARITKYYWDADGQLRYVFEFNGDGEPYGVTDVLYGDHASLADIRPDLGDAEFYETADALPRALAGTGIPPDPH
ncbi:MAG: hypothetical protein DMF86_18845 [Acidobacteria bacterium]|nr:MAG: hypothetical protein DMF86_18845 [Acidobacteriota bacterium]